MCDFCEDIKPIVKGRDIWYREGRESGMGFYEKKGKKIYAYYDECPDSFYSGMVISDMKYCPMCGRRLDEE